MKHTYQDLRRMSNPSHGCGARVFASKHFPPQFFQTFQIRHFFIAHTCSSITAQKYPQLFRPYQIEFCRPVLSRSHSAEHLQVVFHRVGCWASWPMPALLIPPIFNVYQRMNDHLPFARCSVFDLFPFAVRIAWAKMALLFLTNIYQDRVVAGLDAIGCQVRLQLMITRKQRRLLKRQQLDDAR